MDFHCGTTLRESIILFSESSSGAEFYLDNWNIFRIGWLLILCGNVETGFIIIQINFWPKIYSNKILYFIFLLPYFIRYYLNNNVSKEIILIYLLYLIYFDILLQINVVLVLFNDKMIICLFCYVIFNLNKKSSILLREITDE